ncbi:MAG: nuclear transport factor 2 family protein [Pseudomonadales bacterium]
MSTHLGIPPCAIDLADRLAIVDILHSHCRGLDRLDAKLLQQCYWPDADVDYGSYRGSAQDFAGLVVTALGQSYELTRHRIGNSLIELHDATAGVESYVNAVHLFPGGEQEMRFDGRYLDTLEKRDGQWKLLFRQVVMDWSSTRSLKDERQSEAFAAFTKGRHDREDPLYSFITDGDGQG